MTSSTESSPILAPFLAALPKEDLYPYIPGATLTNDLNYLGKVYVKTNSGLFMFSLAILCLAAAPPITASEKDSQLPPKGIVMSPGSQVAANTPYGNITITAKDTLTRLYAWAGDERSVLMRRRDATHPGAFGIYHAAWYKDEFLLFPSVLGFNKTVHDVSEENFKNFESIEKR